MNPFAYVQPRTFDEAAAALAEKRFSLPMLKAGGMDVVDHLKEGLIQPDALVNIKRLRSQPDGAPIAEAGGKVRIEATATMAEIAASDVVKRLAPVLGLSVGTAASPQVRNIGTAAGNLLQRPRCWYYRHEQFDCLKKGGSTCYSIEGENKFHAIFGGGPCHIVHPSNLAPALMVCNGVVHIVGSDRKSLPIAQLFHGPDQGIRSEHVLKPGEVITHITCDAAPRSGFYAIKEKQSFDWPLVAASVSLELDGAKIRSARVCAGAVAPIPWDLPKVEEALKGVSVDDDAALRRACDVAGDGAKPMTDNAYKVRLLPVAVRRATLIAAGRKTEVDA
ncbi:MAG: FAD binding domain-containing protein [Phycisphaerales bacterium]|nr:FAD binding domain-containing protein [Phycisphaerales bacterium]